MKVKAKLKLNDWNVEEGKTYKIAADKVSAKIPPYDGKPEIVIEYRFEKSNGEKGKSKCNSRDFFNMMTEEKEEVENEN